MNGPPSSSSDSASDSAPGSAAAENAICIGLDMGGNDIKFGATNATAEQILLPELLKRPSLAAEGPARTLAQMLDGMADLLGRLDRTWSDVAEIAVTVPCPCTRDGHIIEATNLGTPETKAQWNVPLGHLLAEEVANVAGRAIPVFCCNDANAAGQDDDFERFGNDTSERATIFITTGTGMGGCVIIDGRVLFGGGQAGELGHVKVAIPERYAARFASEPFPRCGCGATQCAETRASLTALIRRVQWACSEDGVAFISADLAQRGETLNPETVATLRRLITEESPRKAAYLVRTFADDDGDAFCRWLLEEWAIVIGLLFATIAPVLHPSLMIIGGGMTEVSPPMRDWFLNTVKEAYTATNAQKSFEIREGSCEPVWSVGQDQGWRGAILMAIRSRANGTPAGSDTE